MALYYQDKLQKNEAVLLRILENYRKLLIPFSHFDRNDQASITSIREKGF